MFYVGFHWKQLAYQQLFDQVCINDFHHMQGINIKWFVFYFTKERFVCSHIYLFRERGEGNTGQFLWWFNKQKLPHMAYTNYALTLPRISLFCRIYDAALSIILLFALQIHFSMDDLLFSLLRCNIINRRKQKRTA